MKLFQRLISRDKSQKTKSLDNITPQISCIRYKEGEENYKFLFNTLSDWHEAKDKDARKYLTIYIYMTYVADDSYQRVPVSDTTQARLQIITMQMEIDSEWYQENEVRSIMERIEREAHTSFEKLNQKTDTKCIEKRNSDSLLKSTPQKNKL